MNLIDILEVINGEIINGEFKNIKYKNVVIDSREVNEGDIFIALKGKNYDGHDFILDVIQKKPSLIIVDKNVKVDSDVMVILVKNTYDVLLKIGAYYRDKFKGKVICITGSVGKTTTKELIYNVLSKKYNVLKSEGNKNNHIGVPLTLTKLNSNYDIAVIELGMNHLNEISILSNICKPNISVITNIGTAHIGNLGSRKKIYKAKMEIINGMNSGYLIVNDDDFYLHKLKKLPGIKVIKCGIKKNNIINIDADIFKSIFYFQNQKFELNVPGSHLIKNCLLAIKVGQVLNISLDDIKKGLSEYKSLNNRLNIYEFNDNIIIDDSYNSNYEAVLETIKFLNDFDKEKLIILGDILELGKYSKKIHKKIGKILKKKKFSNIIFIGKYMYYAHKKIKKSKYFKNNNELINYLSTLKINNSIILIKGSRCMHLEQITKILIDKLKR